MIDNDILTASEAIKEFAAKLKERLFYECGDINYTEVCDTKRVIDKLIKEMTEVEENE